MKLAIQCPIFLGEFRCHPDTLAPGIAMGVVSEAQLLSWSRTGGTPPGWGPKWAQNGHLNDIWWDNGDSAMDLVAFPQTNPAESWSMAQRVFSMDSVSLPCLQAGFFSTQPGFPGATSGSRWWSCRSEWQAWLGMALRKGASISWVKLGWLVQIRLVLTNLVTRKPLVHHHVISCPVVFFVQFWGHIKNRSPDQAANQRTAPSSVYIS